LGGTRRDGQHDRRSFPACNRDNGHITPPFETFHLELDKLSHLLWKLQSPECSRFTGTAKTFYKAPA